eukprot:1167440-Karenia_brevis.AAC.1
MVEAGWRFGPTARLHSPATGIRTWKHVSGPLQATVAVLTGQGWDVSCHLNWKPPRGNSFNMAAAAQT